MKKFLQGHWLGHPLHAIFVHLPVGLWLAAFAFDLISLAGEGSALAVQISFWALVLGLAGAALAVPTGLVIWWDIPGGSSARRIGVTHMALNMMATILCIMNVIFRLDYWQTATSVTSWSLLVSGAQTLLVIISGYLGGRIVYNNGVSIPEQPLEELRHIAQSGRANVPTE